MAYILIDNNGRTMMLLLAQQHPDAAHPTIQEYDQYSLKA